MTETLIHGYSSDSTEEELPNEYQHDRILKMKVFKRLWAIVLWIKVALALEGLMMQETVVPDTNQPSTTSHSKTLSHHKGRLYNTIPL